MCSVDDKAIQKAQTIWGWTDTPAPDHRGCILGAYNQRFHEVERIHFPNPPRPWLHSHIAIGQSDEERWTYCYRISTHEAGCGCGFSVMWCRPYASKIAALTAAAAELHAWLNQNIPVIAPASHVANDDDPDTRRNTSVDRGLAVKLHAWLDSLTQPAQLTLL